MRRPDRARRRLPPASHRPRSPRCGANRRKILRKEEGGAKSGVRRDVVRLVTPGTITEERLLDPARANLFLALSRRRVSDTTWTYGLAAVDISTGRFSVRKRTDRVSGGDREARTAWRSFCPIPSWRIRSSRRFGATGMPPSRRSRDGLDPAFGAAAQGAFRRRDPRELRVFLAHGDHRRGRRDALCGKDPDRAASRPATAEPGLAGGDLVIDAAT